jgi:hypothetical protein
VWKVAKSRIDEKFHILWCQGARRI